MKKSIAILTDIYYPHPMAGGICAHQVAKGLMELGCNVHIVCLKRKGEPKEEIYQGINVHRIKMPLVYKIRDLSERISKPWLAMIIYKLAIILNRILKISLLKWYPLMSPFQIFNYIRCVKRMNIDCVVGEYFSIESAYAAAILKKKYKIKMVMYNVDSLSNSDPAVGLKLEYIRKKGFEWERRIFGIADKIIIMKSHENHYRNSCFNPYRDKLYIADLPLLEWKKEIIDEKASEQITKKTWVYTGSLSKRIRTPDYLFRVFETLNNPSIQLHFFSKGDCEEEIRNMTKKWGDRVVQHGHVAKEKLEKYYSEADFLISIGNLYGDFLPSKTIEYISHMKPIIHFQYQEKDASIPYLKKYGHSLIINVNNNNINDNVEKIKGFILEYERKTLQINKESVEELFKENTPNFTAKIIQGVLED